MIVLLDVKTLDDPTEFHDCIPEEETPIDPPCHMLELFLIPGYNMGHPICLTRSIDSTPIRVLIDSGVACNLLRVDIAQQLGLPFEQITPVLFTTASHNRVSATMRAHNVTIKIQNYTFTGSFLLLNIPGYDLILGAEWLESLGYIG